MRIFIITMEDPVYTLPFIKEIIDRKREKIVGVALASGGRLKVGKKRSRITYILTLLLIMGVRPFLRYSRITAGYKFKSLLSRWLPFLPNPSILVYAGNKGIPIFKIQSPNDRKFLDELKRIQPDVIVHQSQNILKKRLLSIPSIGVINRHNALLPRNRGRLTPFWVLYRSEQETGVSIHFVEPTLDSGPIIVQKRFPVVSGEIFASLVEKNYFAAKEAILEALDKLETGEYDLIPNENEKATYNEAPRFKDAWRYRMNRIWKRRNT